MCFITRDKAIKIINTKRKKDKYYIHYKKHTSLLYDNKPCKIENSIFAGSTQQVLLMINRRHIRIKVMQSAYALLLSETDKLDKQEHYLLESIERLHELYILQLNLLVAILDKATTFIKASKEKYIPTDSPLENSPNLINNCVLQQIKKGLLLQDSDMKEDLSWKTHQELVDLIWGKIFKDDAYNEYMHLTDPDYKADKKIILSIYKNIIAPNDQLAEFYEDEVISWVDDIPFINTWIVGNLNKLNKTNSFAPDPLYKDVEDKQFALELFRKTILNYSKYEKDIDAKTPNWDTERITKIDKLLIVMGIAEFFHFHTIPTKVSINEYIEIAKDYATPKSSFFINGVLDKLLEDYQNKGIIQKVGRGLM